MRWLDCWINLGFQSRLTGWIALRSAMVMQLRLIGLNTTCGLCHGRKKDFGFRCLPSFLVVDWFYWPLSAKFGAGRQGEPFNIYFLLWLCFFSCRFGPPTNWVTRTTWCPSAFGCGCVLAVLIIPLSQTRSLNKFWLGRLCSILDKGRLAVNMHSN